MIEFVSTKRAPWRARAVLTALGLSSVAIATGCQPAPDAAPGEVARTSPVVVEATPPPEVPQADPGRVTQRAAPPTLHPVALGTFESGNPVAESVTGNVTIEGGLIRGENGAEFVTERIAIVRGGDEYLPGRRYADALMIGAEHPVELRRVVSEQSPTRSPGSALCRNFKTGYLAIAKISEDDNDVIRVMGLRGNEVPAPSAQDIAVCTSSQYFARR